MNQRVGAVITAAGMSTRMHDLKQTLPIGEKTIAEHVVSRFAQVGVSPIVVVTGYQAERVREALHAYDVVFLDNPAYATTQMLDTVKIGFEYIQPLCDRVFFTPVDIPLFDIGTLRCEMAADGPIVIPRHGQQPGHPILIGTSVLPAIMRYAGAEGLRGALRTVEAAPLFVDVEDEGALIDADTQEDYRRLQRYHEETLTRQTHG